MDCLEKPPNPHKATPSLPSFATWAWMSGFKPTMAGAARAAVRRTEPRMVAAVVDRVMDRVEWGSA